MEIKATLHKPYDEKQRLDFVVEQNHRHGYEIKETENALEAWGLTEEEIAQQEKQAQRAVLMAQLNTLDLKCIRALRAFSAGTGTQEDEARLSEWEQQAENLRQQIKELED